MAVNIGPRIGIDGEAEYRKQIQQIIQETKTLKSEYEKVSSAMEKGRTTLKGNAEQHRILSEQIKTQEQRVKELADMVDKSSAKFGEADQKTLKWKEALYAAETELNNLRQELNDLPNQIELMGQKMESAGQKISSVGQGITSFGQSLAPLSAAAAGALGGSVKSAIDFESAFAGVKKTVDESAEGYENLSDWIKQASTEMASSKSDIAGVMEVSGQLGVSGVNNLEEFTKTMVMLGDTTNLTSEDAATSLARFMNITGGAYTDSSRLGSSIVALGNNFATSENEIVSMATRLASAGTIAGLSQQEILALATAMSSVGIEAEAGGTAMTQTLNAMEKAVSTNSDKLKGFAEVSGMSAKEFAETWKNEPIMAIQSFINGLSRMNAEDESTVLLLNELNLSGIRQSNMLNALSLANGMLTDAISTSNAAWEEGSALQEEANQRYATTESQLLQTKEKLSNVGIEIGERLLPHLDRLLDKVDGLISAWDGLSAEEQDQIVNAALVAAAAAPVVTGIGNITSALGGIVSGGGKALQMMGSLSGGMSGAATAAGSLGSGAGAASAGIAGIAAPAAVAVGAVALLGGAFITAYQNDEEFAKKVNDDWAEIKQDITDVINVIKPEWEAFSKAFSPVFTAAMESIDRRLEQFKANFQGWADVIHGILEGDWSRAWKGAKDVVFSANDAMQENSRTNKEAIEGIFSKLNIKLPHIKLPHFYVKSTDGFGLPSIGIDWYAKAMDGGMRLTSPTVFGASNGSLLAGGEAGNEWVIGESSILSMIRSAVRSSVGYIPDTGNTVTIGDTQIIINAAPGQDVEEIADAVDEIITMRYQQARQAWA